MLMRRVCLCLGGPLLCCVRWRLLLQPWRGVRRLLVVLRRVLLRGLLRVLLRGLLRGLLLLLVLLVGDVWLLN
jgi:hypothetical protein